MNGHDFIQVAEAREALSVSERVIADDLLDDRGTVGQDWYARHLDAAGQLKVRTFLEFAESRGIRDAAEALARIADDEG